MLLEGSGKGRVGGGGGGGGHRTTQHCPEMRQRETDCRGQTWRVLQGDGFRPFKY